MAEEAQRISESSASEVSFRPAIDTDLPMIETCLLDSWRNHVKHLPMYMHKERTLGSDIRAYYMPALQDPTCRVIIAEVDGKFAGFFRAQIERLPDWVIDPRILYIDDLYVLKQYRKKGVGSKLMEEIDRIAQKEMRVGRIQARVYSWNKHMKRLALRHGYTIPHFTIDKCVPTANEN